MAILLFDIKLINSNNEFISLPFLPQGYGTLKKLSFRTCYESNRYTTMIALRQKITHV